MSSQTKLVLGAVASLLFSSGCGSSGGYFVEDGGSGDSNVNVGGNGKDGSPSGSKLDAATQQTPHDASVKQDSSVKQDASPAHPVDMTTSSTALSCPSGSTVGVAISGRPAYAERLAFYATNRARTNPADTGWPSYSPVYPLLWADELCQSAREHSTDMRDTPCFQHPSCDAPSGTDDTFTRIQMYWTAGFSEMGENISAGISDPQAAITGWINETGAAPGETGHRDNIFDWDSMNMVTVPYTYMGLGYADGGSQYQGYWTQDFVGVDPPPSIPALGSGSHFAGNGNDVTFGTVYYDPSGRAPSIVQVIIDGKATALTLAHGTASLGAYEGSVSLTSGCHRYVFRTEVQGETTCYPGAGTLGATISGTTCVDWSP